MILLLNWLSMFFVSNHTYRRNNDKMCSILFDGIGKLVSRHRKGDFVVKLLIVQVVLA